jgi:hypothetical protein
MYKKCRLPPGPPRRVQPRVSASCRLYSCPLPKGCLARPAPSVRLKDQGSWPKPTHEHYYLTDSYGSVRVKAWSGLHPKTRKVKERYGSESACVVKGTVVLVEVGRVGLPLLDRVLAS